MTKSKTGLTLEFSNSPEVLTDPDPINEIIGPYGASIWPIPFADLDPKTRDLIQKKALSPDEVNRLERSLLLSREELLKVIEKAGRDPQIPGGGSLQTKEVNSGMTFPSLLLAEEGADYSQFDKFHLNLAADGTGVDEILQMLSGDGFRLIYRLPDETILTLTLSCTTNDSGWLLTHAGPHPHMGSMSRASSGTKILGQVIGPAEWEMKFVP